MPQKQKRETVTTPSNVKGGFLLDYSIFGSIYIKTQINKMDSIVQILEIPFLLCFKLYNCQVFII
jgi:hypothetical protein